MAVICSVVVPLTQPAAAQTGNSVVVNAIGREGGETLHMVIDGSEVGTFTLGESANYFGSDPGWETLTYVHPTSLAGAEVRLEYRNDIYIAGQRNRDVRVDKISVDGVDYEAEAPATTSSGVWNNGACRSGNLTSEFLSCNGHFGFTITNQQDETGSLIDIVAVGSTGDEQLDLIIEGQVVRTFDLGEATADFLGATPGWQTYTYEQPEPIDPSTVQLAFANNIHVGAYDRDVRVDKIVVDGQPYEAEAAGVFAVGAFVDGQCSSGFFQTEVLRCGGMFEFGGHQSQDDSVVVVNAVGREGGETLQVVVDGSQVRTFTLDESGNFFGSDPGWETLTYVHPTTLIGSDLRLEYRNDIYIAGQRNRDVRVDKISVDGAIYEAEAPATTSSGVWNNGACRSGNLMSEVLSCNGHFGFAIVQPDDNGEDQAPIANAGPDQQVTAGATGSATVQLDGSASRDPDGSIVDHQWFEGQQLVASGAQPTIDLAAGGHELVLRVTDDDGLVDEDSVAITVENPATMSILTVHAVGSTGEERLGIEIDGETVGTFMLSKAASFNATNPGWGEYTVHVDSELSASQVRLVFANDQYRPADRNVRVDKIEIDGVAFETEDPSVVSSGSWGNGSTCSEGQFSIDNLYCNGYIQYGDAQQTLQVTKLVSDVSTPWGLDFLPSGDLLFTERIGRISIADGATGTHRAVEADLSDVRVEGTSGLLGLTIDPDYATNRRFYTCQTTSGPDQLQVVAWEMNATETAAERSGPALVAEPSFFAHNGCQLRIGADGYLWAAIGDNVVSTAAQDLSTSHGKILRIDPSTGNGAPDNPYAGSIHPTARKIYSFGHRNPQGIAFRPGTDQVFAIEHGPLADDEVNKLVPGGNYGWDPVPVSFPVPDPNRPNYDELNNSMTDLGKFPDAVEPVWASGSPTVAPGGADFLDGDQWGDYEGLLAVALLKGSSLMLIRLDADGNYESEHFPLELDGTYGRLRSATLGPDGSLYVTTTNSGWGAADTRLDHILKVTPNTPS